MMPFLFLDELRLHDMDLDYDDFKIMFKGYCRLNV